MNPCSIWPFAQIWLFEQIRMIFIIFIFGNVPDILLLHYSRS